MTNDNAVRFGDIAVLGGDASTRSHLGASPAKLQAEGVWRVFTQKGHVINDVIVCPDGIAMDWQLQAEKERAILHWPPTIKPHPLCIIIKPSGGVLPPAGPPLDFYMRAGTKSTHIGDPRTLKAEHFTNDKPHWLVRLGADNWIVIEHP